MLSSNCVERDEWVSVADKHRNALVLPVACWPPGTPVRGGDPGAYRHVQGEACPHADAGQEEMWETAAAAGAG